MNKQQVIDHIQNHEELSDAFKQMWIARINQDGLTQDVLDDLRNALDDEIDRAYEDAGVVLDENDPEYKAAYQKMIQDLDTIQDDFEKGMNDLQVQATDTMKATVKQMEDDSVQAIRDSI